VQSAGMAATSCICPKANAASCASRLDASLIATKPPNNKAHHQIQLSTSTPPPPKSKP
jgi:hypothetical protein